MKIIKTLFSTSKTTCFVYFDSKALAPTLEESLKSYATTVDDTSELNNYWDVFKNENLKLENDPKKWVCGLKDVSQVLCYLKPLPCQSDPLKSCKNADLSNRQIEKFINNLQEPEKSTTARKVTGHSSLPSSSSFSNDSRGVNPVFKHQVPLTNQNQNQTSNFSNLNTNQNQNDFREKKPIFKQQLANLPTSNQSSIRNYFHSNTNQNQNSNFNSNFNSTSNQNQNMNFNSNQSNFQSNNQNFPKFNRPQNEQKFPNSSSFGQGQGHNRGQGQNRNEEQKSNKVGFKSAREELNIQLAQKNNRGQQGAKKTLGGKPSTVNSKYVCPLRRDDDTRDNQSPNSDQLGNNEVEEVDERLKNIDPKMIELIKNEIMDCGAKITWDDIAGLEFAKKIIQEIVVFPMLRPDIFTGKKTIYKNFNKFCNCNINLIFQSIFSTNKILILFIF